MSAELLAVLVVAVLVSAVARHYNLSSPLVLVLTGLAFGLIPGLPHFTLDPDLVLFVILPPLLWSAGLESSYVALRQNIKPIGLLAVGFWVLTGLWRRGRRRIGDLEARLGFRSAPVLAFNRLAARKHRAVTRVYDELWDTPGPSEAGRRRSRARGCPPPMAWDDDTIDDPRAVPDLGATPRGLDLDDITALAFRGYTAAQIAERFGCRKDTVTTAVRRAGLVDVSAQLARNASEARSVAA